MKIREMRNLFAVLSSKTEEEKNANPRYRCTKIHFFPFFFRIKCSKTYFYQQKRVLRVGDRRKSHVSTDTVHFIDVQIPTYVSYMCTEAEGREVNEYSFSLSLSLPLESTTPSKCNIKGTLRRLRIRKTDEIANEYKQEYVRFILFQVCLGSERTMVLLERTSAFPFVARD